MDAPQVAGVGALRVGVADERGGRSSPGRPARRTSAARCPARGSARRCWPARRRRRPGRPGRTGSRGRRLCDVGQRHVTFCQPGTAWTAPSVTARDVPTQRVEVGRRQRARADVGVEPGAQSAARRPHVSRTLVAACLVCIHAGDRERAATPSAPCAAAARCAGGPWRSRVAPSSARPSRRSSSPARRRPRDDPRDLGAGGVVRRPRPGTAPAGPWPSSSSRRRPAARRPRCGGSSRRRPRPRSTRPGAVLYGGRSLAKRRSLYGRNTWNGPMLVELLAQRRHRRLDGARRTSPCWPARTPCELSASSWS